MPGSDVMTFAFFPEPGAWGPTNNCVAIANVLRERGQRVVFVIDGSFEGELDRRGFEERVMRMAPPEEDADPTADPWAEFIRMTAPKFTLPSTNAPRRTPRLEFSTACYVMMVR